MTCSSSRRPVALLTPRFWPDAGGVAVAASRLARGLAEHGPLEVLVPSAEVAPGAVRAEAERNLTVVRFGALSREDAQRRWFELLKRRGPYRLVHGVYLSEAAFVATLAARYLSIACLVSARGNDLNRDLFRADRQAGLLHALAGADAVVGVSRDLCRLATALGAERGRTHWVPNGVSAAEFFPEPPDAELAAAWGIAGASPVVLFSGEARLGKGLPTLLQAFALLAAEHERAALVLLGGVRKPDRPLVEVFCAQHPQLAPRIHVIERVDGARLRGAYALADVVWLPSYSDGLPNAALEALACGRSVVGSRVGGLIDVLAPWPQLLVEPEDPAALVDATRALLADSEAKRRLEAEARAYVRETFGLEREVASYLALYETLAPSDA